MNIVEKLGLYDILAMFVPGYLLIRLFEVGCKGLVFDNLYHGLIVVVVCYVVGLVWHKLMELVFRPLRNNDLGLALGRAIAYGETSKRRGKTIEAEPNIRTKYYEAYYRLGGKLGAIPVIERQVALLQNLMFILPFLVAKYVPRCLSEKYNSIELYLLFIPVFIVPLAMCICYHKEFFFQDIRKVLNKWKFINEVVKWFGFMLFALCVLRFVNECIRLSQSELNVSSWLVFISFVILLGVYKLLQIKVYSMVWEADAYVTEDPKDPKTQRGEQTVS